MEGVVVGHWTDAAAKTGCTVVVLPEGTVASGEVRGGAPATREFALLDPTRTVATVDAVVLTGGSAFGLASADGVVEGLAAAGRGFPTGFGSVPIVVAMGLFDLSVGDSSVRPGPEEGRHALAAATTDCPLGPVGAGTGATTDKWSGDPEPSGLGGATVRVPTGAVSQPGDDGRELVVSALVAVNAFGRIDDGTTVDDPGPPVPPPIGTDRADGHDGAGEDGSMTNTTIGLIVTNARIDKTECHWLARSGHDGLARALFPAHTPVDGDALVAAATGQVEANPMHLRVLAQIAVTRAVRSVPRR